MSGQQFDDLTKAVANGANGTTRRSFLTGLAAAAAALIAPRAAGAQLPAPGGSTCANQGESCTAQQCCAGLNCLTDETSGTDRFCCVGNVVCQGHCCPTGVLTGCINGKCPGCPNGLSICPDETNAAGKCIDLQNDVLNCGGCGNECPPGTTCQNGSCVCTPASCPNGCCEDNQCKSGTSNTACGTGGVPCVACSAAACLTCDQTTQTCTSVCGVGQVCNGQGQCICNATSCPNGCCDGTTCRAGNTNQACGSNGITCVACPSGTECRSGSCVSLCGPGTCTGCCQNNTCEAGTNNQACGRNGVLCVTCPTGTRCENGICVCNKNSGCSGCCLNNVCHPGTTSTLCGGGGDTCVTCTGLNVCCGGQCKLPTGASCSGNGNCCSNRCREGVCTT